MAKAGWYQHPIHVSSLPCVPASFTPVLWFVLVGTQLIYHTSILPGVSRQVGVTRKVLRGWKAQEERLRASRTGSRRVRVGRNRERRKIQEVGGKGDRTEHEGETIEPEGHHDGAYGDSNDSGSNHDEGSSSDGREDHDDEPEIIQDPQPSHRASPACARD